MAVPYNQPLRKTRRRYIAFRNAYRHMNHIVVDNSFKPAPSEEIQSLINKHFRLKKDLLELAVDGVIERIKTEFRAIFPFVMTYNYLGLHDETRRNNLINSENFEEVSGQLIYIKKGSKQSETFISEGKHQMAVYKDKLIGYLTRESKRDRPYIVSHKEYLVERLKKELIISY